MIRIEPATPALAARSSAEALGLSGYRKLALIRAAEAAILKHYGEDEMKTPMHMSVGQEAPSVGVCLALGDRGQIFATYRSHAAFLARTENVHAFFAELYGRTTGIAQGKAGSMHLARPSDGHVCSSAIVGSCLPLAVGAAFAYRQKKEDKISCVFFGDGALDEGAFWESLNSACVMKLPVVFVCEDNNWAVHTGKAARAGYNSITAVVQNLRCQAATLDTTDVEEIAKTAADLIETSRTEQKPVFLQIKCCRYLEHCGINSDLELGYRSKAEVQDWRAKDPVAGQRNRLLQRGVPESVLAEIDARIANDVADAVRAAKAASQPDVKELWARM